MKTDARQPRHSHCLQCGQQRRRPAKGHKSAIDAWLDDGFCSTECARKWHRNPLPERSIWGREAEAS